MKIELARPLPNNVGHIKPMPPNGEAIIEIVRRQYIALFKEYRLHIGGFLKLIE